MLDAKFGGCTVRARDHGQSWVTSSERGYTSAYISESKIGGEDTAVNLHTTMPWFASSSYNESGIFAVIRTAYIPRTALSTVINLRHQPRRKSW